MFLVSVSTISVLKSIGQLITLLVVFAFVVGLAYLASKMAAKFQMKTMRGSNIEIIETQRLANNKLIQIVKIGDKTIAVGIGKEEVTFLTELDAESIIQKNNKDIENDKEISSKTYKSFQEIFQNINKHSK